MGLRAGSSTTTALSFPARFQSALEAKTGTGSKTTGTRLTAPTTWADQTVVWLTAWFSRPSASRWPSWPARPAGSDSLVQNWKPLANDFFLPMRTGLTSYLKKKPFTLYFAASDAGIIQARKAGVWAVRLRKSGKSSLPAESTPRKFKEPVLPLSEF